MKKIKLFIVRWVLPFTMKAAAELLKSKGYTVTAPKKTKKK